MVVSREGIRGGGVWERQPGGGKGGHPTDIKIDVILPILPYHI